MDLFRRKKKATEAEDFNEEMRDEEMTEEIPFTDKRRININENGETSPQQGETQPKTDTKSAEVIRLENELKDERNRREAAEAKLVGVQSKFEEVKNNLEKETADMRERMRKTLEQRAMQGQFNFLTTLLPVLDNLHLAIRAAENNPDQNLLAGLQGTVNGFEMALLQVGVEPVLAVGEPFNPELHEAVDIVESDQDGVVTAEYSRGYRFGDRLLRPARVQVGRASAQAAAE
ncbi:MAG: nucleotide exchange factor GrpE [Acidobacteriota bacterium]|nr:nucleotide exchange factor GrpE [Acidobacteriota bacterium]